MTTVFGVDHSPWTQAVVLAHADRGIPVCLRPYPTLSYFLRFGLVMPVCWDANGQEMEDSLFIIQTLMSSTDADTQATLESDFTALEILFLAYALDRIAPGQRLAFIGGWGRMTDVPLTPTSIALRALLCWYFFVLVSAGRAALIKRRSSRSSEARLTHRLAPWVARLEGTPFLGGDTPSASDYGLLGHLECMSSGLTDWTMPVVAEQPVLMAWLERMHTRLTDHDTLYSRRIRDPDAGPAGAGPVARGWFALWMVLWIVALPLTLTILGYALLRRARAANRTGGRLERSSGD